MGSSRGHEAAPTQKSRVDATAIAATHAMQLLGFSEIGVRHGSLSVLVGYVSAYSARIVGRVASGVRTSRASRVARALSPVADLGVVAGSRGSHRRSSGGRSPVVWSCLVLIGRAHVL